MKAVSTAAAIRKFAGEPWLRPDSGVSCQIAVPGTYHAPHNTAAHKAQP